MENAKEDLIKLADLLKTHNAIGRVLSVLINRPASIGHLGEYVAANIFNIQLEMSANQRGIDGHFVEGALAGRSVNIKWYSVQTSILDITPNYLPDCYLVLAGPKSKALPSRGAIRPLVIESAFLFESSV
jgi:hypothetical protein